MTDEKQPKVVWHCARCNEVIFENQEKCDECGQEQNWNSISLDDGESSLSSTGLAKQSEQSESCGEPPKPDAWLMDVNYHGRSKTKKLQGFVSRWEPPLRIESHIDLKAMIEDQGWDWGDPDVVIGFSGQKPLFAASTVQEAIEELRQKVMENKRQIDGQEFVSEDEQSGYEAAFYDLIHTEVFDQ